MAHGAAFCVCNHTRLQTIVPPHTRIMQRAIRSHLPHHSRLEGPRKHGPALRYLTSTKTFKIPAAPGLHRSRQTPARQVSGCSDHVHQLSIRASAKLQACVKVCRASKLPVYLPTAITPIVSNKFLQGEAKETGLAYLVATTNILSCHLSYVQAA